MCAPQALVALQAIQAAGQAFNKIESQKQQKSQAEKNARLLNEQAREQRRQGQLSSNKQKIETAQRLAREKNALAAAGITTDQGTAKDLLEDTKALGEAERLESLKRSKDKAANLERRASNELSDLSYSSSKTNRDLFGQGSTLLTRNFNTFSKRGLLKY